MAQAAAYLNETGLSADEYSDRARRELDTIDVCSGRRCR